MAASGLAIFCNLSKRTETAKGATTSQTTKAPVACRGFFNGGNAMQKSKREIAISNRYLYYYASLLKRVYGFVIRKEHGKDERYTGRLDEDPVPSPLPEGMIPPKVSARAPGVPVRDEIVLFRFRKRLLLGTCQGVLSRRISEIAVLAEDDRHLRFRHKNLVYLSGISACDTPLKTYATAVRALSREIDLEDVWELAVESDAALSLSEIADLFYDGDADATRWMALYLHLHRACVYFRPHASNSYAPYAVDQVGFRRQRESGQRDRDEEREEFIHAMQNRAESIAEHTMTSRQQTYLEQIRQYALWGRESQRAPQARALLAEICPNKKDRQKAAVELLVQKRVWDRDENLDLLRAEVPIAFSEDAIRQAETLASGVGYRKKQKGFAIHLPDRTAIALSFRRRLFRGPEFGVHIPDIAALIPKDSPLDREAADRGARIPFPDHPIPLLPPRIAHDLGTFQRPRPALSIFWRVDRGGRIEDFCIAQTTVVTKADLTLENVDRALADSSHPQRGAIQFFSQLAARLCEKRQMALGDLEAGEPQSAAHRIARELRLLAAVAVGRWCDNKGIPAIYETRDPVENAATLRRIPHPVVRRHERHRHTPRTDLNTAPGIHHGCGISHCCPIAQPLVRYADLAMQRQIAHYLQTEQVLYSVDDLNALRYRLWETQGLIDGLVYRHTRDLLLRSWERQLGREFRAVVLHIKRRGALVELLDHPFKTVIYPGHPVAVGDEIDLRLTGVDRWKGWAHFTVSHQPSAVSSHP